MISVALIFIFPSNMPTYYAVAFFSGLAVMGVEITSSRLLAPYFGTSLFVWTNVIGVILIALSLGYYLGGKISEKNSSLKTLFGIIFFAGAFVAVIPFVIRPIAGFIYFDSTVLTSASLFIALGSFFLTSILFFVPMMLLGMVSPFLIKLASLKRNDVGRVAGQIFAVGTVGSIVGTFLPVLILIPTVGTRLTILIFAGILLVIGLIGLSPRGLFIFIPFLAVPFGMLNSAVKLSPNIIYQTESPFQYIRVERGSDETRYLVYNEGGGVQSVFNPNNVFTGNYFDIAAVLPAINDGKKVLIVGLAGGTISRSMSFLFGEQLGFHIDGVEIDPKVTSVAMKYFDLEQSKLTLINADGRNQLAFNDSMYDIIFVDAYANQIYIPFHLATTEFFKIAESRLSGGGIFAINVNASSEDSTLLRSISNTISGVFPYTYKMRVGRSWNYIIFAGDRPIDFGRLAKPEFIISEFFDLAQKIPAQVSKVEYDSRVPLLTDDWAPLEYMTDSMIWKELARHLAES